MFYYLNMLYILEYGCIVWSPQKKKLIGHVEKVQHRFTKLSTEWKALLMNKENSQSAASHPSIQKEDRTAYWGFQAAHNMYDTDYFKFFDKASDTTTRDHSRKLKTTYSRINCRANFFSVIVVSDWNSLPETVANSTSLNQFKGSLDRHLQAEMFALIWHLVEILRLIMTKILRLTSLRLT